MDIFQKITVLSKLLKRAYDAHQDKGKYHSEARQLWEETLLLLEPHERKLLPENIHKKMRWYMVDCRFLGELLAGLVNQEIGAKEADIFMKIGVLGGFSDLMVDEMRVKREQIEALLLEKKEVSEEPSPIEKLYFIYRENLYEIVPPRAKAIFTEVAHKAFEAQINSSEQFEKKTSFEHLKKIAYDKGGVAAISIASVLDNADLDVLEKPLYKVGGLIQLLNDTQDMHKDAKEHINTFVTHMNTFTDIAEFLEKERQNAFKLYQKLPYPKANVEAFVFKMTLLHLGILYKLHCFRNICNNQLDLKMIAKMNKEKFRISPFNLQALGHFFGEISRFHLYTVHINHKNII